ncbi:hypothetical protein LEMLEM_LOCUS13830 [Lemmus lemmus]
MECKPCYNYPNQIASCTHPPTAALEEAVYHKSEEDAGDRNTFPRWTLGVLDS